MKGMGALRELNDITFFREIHTLAVVFVPDFLCLLNYQTMIIVIVKKRRRENPSYIWSHTLKEFIVVS